MCTAITYQTKNHYFGRNLDFETTFGEQVVLMPRRYELCYKCLKEVKFSSGSKRTLKDHYAVLGMAVVADDYPLFFGAVNEKGLAMAGLHFVGNAHYAEPKESFGEFDKELDSVTKSAIMCHRTTVTWRGAYVQTL